MNIIEQLRLEEGERLFVYDDETGQAIVKGSVVRGYPTIGVGRMIDKSKGGGISREESAFLLNNDVRECEAALDARLLWWRDLNEPRRAVLIGMAFQMGMDGLLGFRNTLAMVQRGDYASAARGMLNSKWATQTPKRAHRMSEQMRTGAWQ